ncbi:MAG: ribosomal-processing cysteine protease Prp [Acutalibacteraceae bacterium]|nr:ribosomal-processing cysteine protease Prp [Acutalibacteraceae bacterium]
MIKATFYKKEGILKGFEISGHSGYAEEGSDIICASVSSAAYMTVNTVTDVIGEYGEAEVDEGYLRFICESDKTEVQAVMKGFLLHVNALADEYNEYIICKEKTV